MNLDEKVRISMKKLLKFTALIMAISGVIGIVYNIFKAKKMQQEEDDFGFDAEDKTNITRKVFFNGLDEVIEIGEAKSVNLLARFAGVDVELIDWDLAGGDLTLDVDCSFAGIDLTLPRPYHIENQAKVLFGGINYSVEDETEGLPTLTITGHILMGGLNIKIEDESEYVTVNVESES